MIEAIFAALLAQTTTDNTPAPPPRPQCNTEGHAQFDFWVGEWDVSVAGQDTVIANSSIERLHNGCAVREHWQPLQGPGGSSLNHYDASTGLWHQKWVGSSPGEVIFTGGFTEGKMVLTGYWPAPNAPQQIVRMTYSRVEEGAVRQFGEASTDFGLTWSPSFDLIYRPREDTGD